MEAEHDRSLPNDQEEARAVEAVEQGIQCLKSDEDRRAIECFTEAIRLNPECARAYRLRGEVYDRMGNWAKAERDIARARRAEARRQ